MSINQKTKESIADALAVAIRDAAIAASFKSTTKATHYDVFIGVDGYVQISFLTAEDNPGKGWIPLDE